MFLQYLQAFSSRDKQACLYLFNNNSKLCQRNRTDITILQLKKQADIYFTFNICMEIDPIHTVLVPNQNLN